VGGEVYGVSLDGLETHRAFAESLKLNFPLVADPNKTLARAFGVLWLGGLLPITKRATFVVDGAGVVQNVIASEFSIDKHINEAIATLRSIG
jgi:thioredoxin-dependent peroxiredoxin